MHRCTQTKPFMLWFVIHSMFLSPGDQYSVYQCHCIVQLHNEKKKKKRQLLLFHRPATASLHLHATTNLPNLFWICRFPVSNTTLQLLHSSDSPFVTSRRWNLRSLLHRPDRRNARASQRANCFAAPVLPGGYVKKRRPSASLCLSGWVSEHTCCVGGQRRRSGSA